MTSPHTFTVVMAHREAQATFDRHLPLWKSLGFPVVVFTPEDSPVKYDGEQWSHGVASHHGGDACLRFRWMLNAAADRCLYKGDGNGRVLVFEYDAIPITKDIPTGPGLYGNVFHDDGPDRGFIGQTFIHPPLFISYPTLNKVLKQMNRVDLERNFWDRYLGLACERAGVVPIDLMAMGLGFAQNTIENPEDARKARESGAVFFHGVKTKEVLRAILGEVD